MTLLDDRPAIAAGSINRAGAVLLVQRRVKEGALSWQFPAGEVEPSESLEAAAVRETVEETGLVVTATQLLGDRVHPKTGRRMAYVACETVSGTAYVATTRSWQTLPGCSHKTLQISSPTGSRPSSRTTLEEKYRQSA